MEIMLIVATYESLDTVSNGLVGDGMLGQEIIGYKAGNVLVLHIGQAAHICTLLQDVLNVLRRQRGEVGQVGHVPMGRRHTRLDQGLLQLAWHVVAGRQPVVMRLELGCDHTLAETSQPTEVVQV